MKTQTTLKMAVKAGLALLGIWSCAAIALTDQAYQSVSRYNVAGQKTAEISADPDGSGPLNRAAKRYTYSDGLLMSIESGYITSDTWQDESFEATQWQAGSDFILSQKVVYSYDTWGRKATEKVIDDVGTAVTLTQYSYDPQGLVECVAKRMNPSYYNALPGSACEFESGSLGNYGPDRITRFTYNSLDKVLSETRAYKTDLEQTYRRNTYIENVVLETVTDANNNLTQYAYDEHGRLTHTYFPTKTAGTRHANLLDYEQYGYDLNGNRTSLRKRDGKTISYEYDDLNRMIYKDLPDGEADVYYGYDLQGLQTYARFGSHSNATNAVVTDYSGFGELKQETINFNGSNHTILHAYDKNGNRRQTTFPDSTQNYITYGYDATNRVTAISERNTTTLYTYTYNDYAELETAVTGGDVATTLYYDGIGRLEQVDYNAFGNTNDLFIDYAYNPAGQLIKQDISNSHYHYQGDSGRLGGYKANGLNQYVLVGTSGTYLTEGGKTFSYDDNGNLTSDGDRTYVYDSENRLKTVGSNASFTYDPLGRLLTTTINGKTLWYLNSGDNLVAEYSGSQIVTRYIHAANMGTPVAQYNGAAMNASSLMYLHKNHQGSVIAQSNATGSIVNVNAYDEYGMSADENVGRFGYTGQLYFPELGLYHYRARFYWPEIGRFLQTDPVGYEDQMNLYAYVHNDPLNMSDPTGMESVIPEETTVTCDLICQGIAAQQRIAQEFIQGMKNAENNIMSVVIWRTTGIKTGMVAAISDMFNEVKPAPGDLPAFPDAKPVKPKTSVQGGGGKRKRWKDSKGRIYEWDSKKGEVEVYDKTGKKHKGGFSPDTGEQISPPKGGRSVEP